MSNSEGKQGEVGVRNRGFEGENKEGHKDKEDYKDKCVNTNKMMKVGRVDKGEIGLDRLRKGESH